MKRPQSYFARYRIRENGKLLSLVLGPSGRTADTPVGEEEHLYGRVASRLFEEEEVLAWVERRGLTLEIRPMTEEQGVAIKAQERAAALEAEAERLKAENERLRAGIREIARCNLAEKVKQTLLVTASPKERFVRSGIYFLICKDEVVYVGQSINIFGRVATHSLANRDFDSVSFIECSAQHLNELESFYIRLLRPKLNRCRAEGQMRAPKDTGELDAILSHIVARVDVELGHSTPEPAQDLG